MYIVIMFISLITVSIISFIVGKTVTELIKLPVWLDMKPFNCRKCCTTHLTWVLNTLVGLILSNWIYIILGIIMAICSYVLINNEEKKQW